MAKCRRPSVWMEWAVWIRRGGREVQVDGSKGYNLYYIDHKNITTASRCRWILAEVGGLLRRHLCWKHLKTNPTRQKSIEYSIHHENIWTHCQKFIRKHLKEPIRRRFDFDDFSMELLIFAVFFWGKIYHEENEDLKFLWTVAICAASEL